MSTKLKALGLGILAMLAVGAFAVVNAGATTGGHFTSNSGTGKTILTGTEDGEGGQGKHTTELAVPGLTPITCTDSSYVGTVAANTATQITITPTYKECATTGASSWNQVSVDMKGCDYRFKIGNKATEDNTVDLVCPTPTTKVKIVHGSSCTIEIPGFENNKGVSYTTDILNGKHAITVDATAKGFNVTFEAGFCVLLGTEHEGEFTGSVTVEGFADEEGTEGAQVDITAVGAEEL